MVKVAAFVRFALTLIVCIFIFYYRPRYRIYFVRCRRTFIKEYQIYFNLDSGRTLAFKPDDESTFLVGTDEGLVFLCTTQYSSRLVHFVL